MNTMETAIEVLANKAKDATTAHEALQFAQAALNLASITWQPARQPLTDEQIDAGMDKSVLPLSMQEAFGAGVRYAERVRGIGGQAMKCKCEHWQECPTCTPHRFDAAGNRKSPKSDPIPRQRKPLTDEKLAAMWEADMTSNEDHHSLYFFILIARAVEQAHGIGETK
jgi:hypothetical protein